MPNSNFENNQDETVFAPRAIERIKENMDKFTPRQKTLANFVLQNTERIVFLSITELAKEAGVSQTTIFRFCTAIGYDGYLPFSREIQHSIQLELNGAGRFKLTHQHRKDLIPPGQNSIFQKIVSKELDNLSNLFDNIKIDDYYECIDLLLNADRICIVGCLASTPLAIHMGQMLSKIFPSVDTILNHNLNTSAILRNLTEKSVVFTIAFPRYPRDSYEITKLAKDTGAKIVCMTNTHHCPIVPMADIPFIITVSIPSYVDSFTTPMAFITALVTELSEQNPDDTKVALKKYDEYVSKMELFIQPRGHSK